MKPKGYDSQCYSEYIYDSKCEDVEEQVLAIETIDFFKKLNERAKARERETDNEMEDW